MTAAAIWVLSAGCGLLMAIAAGAGSPAPATLLTAAMVLAGMVLRQAATLAVLLAVGTAVVSDPAPALAALAGLAAVGYLLLRYAAGGLNGTNRPGIVTVATIVGAVGFTFVGLAAAAFPLQLPWLPLLAPPAAFGCYALAVRPFV